jgi:hypothetical protein
LLLLLASAASWSCAAPVLVHPHSRAEDARSMIWRDRGPVGSLNLIYGAGGKAHAPDARGTFTFLKEDMEATNPKFSVVDSHGVEWKVKLGEETQSETAAARFVWAAGYFVDEDYFLPELTVKGLPELRRGEQFVSAGGTVHHARLERKLKDEKKDGTWDWFENPFSGQRDLNGLRVMMALVNNWDLKVENNQIYEVRGERRYVVTDLGASFGNTGNSLTRTKSNPVEYAESAFVQTVTSDHVDLVLHSRPFFMGAVEPANYQMRTRIEAIARTIPRADAKWIGHRLSLLSDRQIGDGFRAAGYAADEVAVFSTALRKRISALNAL